MMFLATVSDHHILTNVDAFGHDICICVVCFRQMTGTFLVSIEFILMHQVASVMQSLDLDA